MAPPAAAAADPKKDPPLFTTEEVKVGPGFLVLSKKMVYLICGTILAVYFISCVMLLAGGRAPPCPEVPICANSTATATPVPTVTAVPTTTVKPTVTAAPVPTGPTVDTATNAILFVANGAGPASFTLARGFKGSSLVHDQFFVGSLSGTSASSSSLIADGGASCSAAATGGRSMNGRIGVDDAGTAARGNLIEAALLAGKAVGIVSTGDVTGTGAAAFTAHTLVKDMNEAVAVQQVGKGLSVLIGGGANRFQPTTRSDRRDLILELRRRNINVAVNPTQFRALQTPPVAAFLAPGALPAEIDRNVTAGTPTLEEMVIKAVDILRKDRKAGTAGYLLVVIGANLESLAETGDVHGHVSELLAWDKAFNYARSVAAGDSSRKTLVASISDGEVGGLVIGGGTFIARNTALRSRQGGLVGPSMDPVAAGQIIKAPSELVRDKFLADAALDAIYPNFWSTAPLRTAVKSAAAIAAAVRAATPSPENPLTSAQLSVIVSAGLGLTTDTALSAAEVALVLSGYRFSLKLWGPANTASLSEQLSAKPLEQAIGKVVSSRANAGFTHHGRGGQDTNVYAMGAASQRYAGLRSHSDFAKLTAEILGIDLDAATTSSSAVDIGGCPWADARCSP